MSLDAVRGKRAFLLLLGSLLAANPFVVLYLTGRPLVAAVAFTVVFLLLAVADKASGKGARWPLVYAVNFVLLGSAALHGEFVFRLFLSEHAPKDLYDVRSGYPFNRPFLRETLTDPESKSVYTTNGQGFRIPPGASPEKTLDRCDWLFVGDSFTQGAQVDYDQLYTSRLQRYFPDKVIVNAGVSGIGIPEQYAMLKDLGPKLRPRTVFLQVSTFNDFMNVAPREMNTTEYLIHHSELARFVFFDFLYTNREGLPLGRWTEPFYPTPRENARYNVFYRPTSPEKESDLQAYQSYLQKTLDLCRDLKANLVVLVVPSKEQGDRRFLEEVVGAFRLDPKQLDMDAPTKRLREWLKGTSGVLLDTTDAFRHSSVPLFFDVDEHMNTEGHEAVAAEIAAQFGSGSWIYEGIRAESPLFCGARYPTFSADGRLMAYQVVTDSRTQGVVIDRTTGLARIVDAGGPLIHPVLSPDGKKLAFTLGDVESKAQKVVLFDLETGERRYVTHRRNQYGAIPQFSRDGKTIAFAQWYLDDIRKTYTTPQIAVEGLDGSFRALIGDGRSECWRPCFSPDGKSVAYISRRTGNFDLYRFDLETKTDRSLTSTPYDEWDPSFSPDGERLAYAAKQDGTWDLFEMDVKTGHSERLTESRGDEWDPVYSPDGLTLFFAGEHGFAGGVYSIPLKEARRAAGHPSGGARAQ